MDNLVGFVSHHDREVQELGEDREFAIAYLQFARESLENPDERDAGLLALRALTEAYGDLSSLSENQ